MQNAALESFPALIGQKISEAGLLYSVINAGLSGDTSNGGLNRLDYWLSQPIDVFILELGINDVIRNIPPQTTSRNLQTIIDKVRMKYPHIKIALMGMQIPLFIKSPFAVQFNAVYKNIAAINNISLVPFFIEGVAGKSNLNLSDKLHPSANGYKVIAANVWPVISKLIV